MTLPPNDPNSIKPRRKHPRRNFLDANEVAANKRGEITPTQHASLRYELIRQGLTAVVFMGLGIGLPLYPIAAGLFTPYHGSPQDVLWLITLAGGAVLLGLPGIVQGVRLFRSLGAARQEIAASEIDQAEGEVKWTGDIYAAFVDRRRLKPIYSRLGLRPGQYHFYYLRRSRWLLSAEKMTIRDDFDSITEMQRVLAITNHFSLEDLAANRERHMTTRQRLRLWLPAPRSAPYSRNVLDAQRAPQVFYGTVISIGLLVLLGLRGIPFIFLTLFLIFRLTVLIDTLTGYVEMIEGRGQREKPHSRYDGYQYLLGGQRFRVSSQAHNALIVGQPYRVYYARYSKRLLSIEPLESPRDKTS